MKLNGSLYFPKLLQLQYVGKTVNAKNVIFILQSKDVAQPTNKFKV